MNWDQLEGKWKQLKGAARMKWAQLSEDDLDQIDGRKERLIGKIQERYGLARERAEQQVEEWLTVIKEPVQARGAHPAR